MRFPKKFVVFFGLVAHHDTPKTTVKFVDHQALKASF
jgi:hypothetical protein